MMKNYVTTPDIQTALDAFRRAQNLSSEGEAVRLAICLTTTLTGLPMPAHKLHKGRRSPETANDRRARFDIMQVPLPLRLDFVPWINTGQSPSRETLAAAVAAGVSDAAIWAAFGGEKP